MEFHKLECLHQARVSPCLGPLGDRWHSKAWWLHWGQLWRDLLVQGHDLLTNSTPWSWEVYLVISDKSMRFMWPKPPFFLSVFIWARWLKRESTWHCNDSTLWNSVALSLKVVISIGRTKVKSEGRKKSTKYFPLKSSRLGLPWWSSG